MQALPDKLYTVDSVVKLEQLAITEHGISAYELMKRAAAVVFNVLKNRFPECKKTLVVCGAGNNAGDGYVVAALAKQAGIEVSLLSLVSSDSLTGAALLAYNDWCRLLVDEDKTESVLTKLAIPEDTDVIIDAMLGTGLKRLLTSSWYDCIEQINQSNKPVISIDIPSGLYANTGSLAGIAVQADITVTFIGLKQGMFTAQGKDVCGEIVFDKLSLPDNIYSTVKFDARLITEINYALLPKRKASAHKGCFGHVLIVGGNTGMPGAVILSARAALRAGAGLVTIITIAENAEVISAAVPEAMLRLCDDETVDNVLKENFSSEVTHVAVGMGLGQDAWALSLLQQCIQLNKPLLIDADGLNLLARHNLSVGCELIITPHPGEAGRLLNSSPTEVSVKNTSATIQEDRFAAVVKLYEKFKSNYGLVVILKGSGTLIYDGHMTKVCNLGTSAMAAPGMGDVLSGILVALMAQNSSENVSLSDIAELGTCLHASAAQLSSGDKTRGLLASDVVDSLKAVLQ